MRNTANHHISAGIKRILATTILVVALSQTVSIAEKVTLTWMNWYTTGNYAPIQQRIIDEFEKQHPDINVEMEVAPYADPSKLLILIGSGSAPDIIWVVDYELGWYIGKDLLLDLSKYHDKSPVHINEWIPTVKQTATAFGGLWGVPFDMINIYGLTYNRNIFAAGGVNPPSDTWTWDDYMIAAKKLTLQRSDGTIAQSGGELPYRTNATSWPGPGFLRSFGGYCVSPDGKDVGLDQPGSIAAYNYLREYIRNVMGGTQVSLDFTAGQLGMDWQGTWNLGQVKSKSNFEWGIALTPQGPAGRFNSMSYTFWSVPKASKHTQEAYEFIKFANENWAMQVYASGGRISPRIPLALQMDESQLGINKTDFAKVFLNQMVQSGYAELPVTWYNEARTLISQNRTQIISPAKPVVDVVGQVATKIRTEIISKYK